MLFLWGHGTKSTLLPSQESQAVANLQRPTRLRSYLATTRYSAGEEARKYIRENKITLAEFNKKA